MRNSKIQTNSLYDLSSFTTTIPYCDYIVAEKDFVSLAKQAKLDKQYRTVITDSLSTLKGLYN